MPRYTPSLDGEVHDYISQEAQEASYFQRRRRVIFINGMGNSGADHAESAEALSLLQMCTVRGIYNASGGFFSDLGQCIADKWQFDGGLAKKPSEALDAVLEYARKKGQPLSREEAMRAAISRNPACLATYDVVRRGNEAEIFAHSQGNLILSNALSALEAVGGPAAARLGQLTVHTYGSPAVNWPKGVRKLEHAFTWDPVTFLAGVDWSFSISKLGAPGGYLQPISHAFALYLENDAAFIVNRFRWGGLGVTFTLDEKGLAECLVAMGRNLRRVQKVFEHLNLKHNSDADDVAVLYIEKLKAAPGGDDLVRFVKSRTELRQLLIRILDEGWTSPREKKIIELLKT